MSDESHQLQATGTLHLLEKDGTVSYRFNGDDTMMVLTKKVAGSSTAGVSKFEDATIKITIELDYNGTIYEGIQP